MLDGQVQETPYLEICIWMQKLQSAIDVVQVHVVVGTGAINKIFTGTSSI